MSVRLALAVFFLASTTHAVADDSTPYLAGKKQGVRTCLDRLQTVANFIVADRPHASHDVWSNNAVDSRMFSSFVVKGYSDGDSHVSIVVGPDKTGRCYAEYNESAYWPEACTIVREKVFSKLKYVDSLKQTTAVLESESGAVNVYLTPQENGNACLTTKREVIFYSAD
jgi:hypothetical protein